MNLLKLLVVFCAIALLGTGCWRTGSTAPSPSATSPTITPSSPADSSASPPAVPSPTETIPNNSPSSEPSTPPAATSEDEAVDRIVASLTLEQKIGQLLLVGVRGQKVNKTAEHMIANNHVGGIILFKNNLAGGLHSAANLLNDLKEANRHNPLPLLLSVDQEGGRVSRLPKDFDPMPANAVVGRTGDANLAEQMGGLIAEQLRLLGFNVNFAPVLDVFSNPRNKVIGDRSFGSNPELVAQMGLAEMKGMREGGIIPVVKHFPGHGDTLEDSHTDLPIIHKTKAELAALELIPFVQAIDAGTDMVMIAHILFPALDPDAPSSLSCPIITDLLRSELGFNGVVITDDIAMGAITKHYGLEDAAVRAITAGADILLTAHDGDDAQRIYNALVQSVQDKRISEARIDESVRRIVRLKRAYALRDESVPVPNASDIPNDAVHKWREQVSEHADS